MSTPASRSDSYILKRLRHLGLTDTVARLVASELVQRSRNGHRCRVDLTNFMVAE